MRGQGDSRRFIDPGTSIYELAKEVLVVCPQCHTCAVVRNIDPQAIRNWFAPRILTCVQCGYSRRWAETQIRRGWQDTPVVDDYFGEPLWLQGPCEGKVLWAYNMRHLLLLEQYIGARVRESPRRTNATKNQSMLSRLPRWMTAAKNREAVLRGIQKLKAK